ncbi:MAG: lytic transglycosylase domain-containing protein [Myxococcota bacterium]|nr:lytic transglycosylase domain-containing protein [Myxococcota bacterium]
MNAHRQPWASVTYCAVFIILAVSGFVQAETVSMASVEVRVGQYEKALSLLKTLPPKTAQSSSAQLVTAKAQLGLGDLKAAAEALSNVDDKNLRTARDWVRYRLAVAAGDLHAVRTQIDRILGDEQIPNSHKEQAQLYFAKLAVERKEGRGKAKKLLRKLAVKAKDYSLRAAAWSVLSEVGDKRAKRALLVHYPAHAIEPGATQTELPIRLSESAKKKRAHNLFDLRAYQLAQVDYLVLSKSSDPELRQLAQMRLGIIRMRMRDDYPQSAKWFRRAKSGPNEKIARESAYRYAIVLGYMGRYKEASRLMERLAPDLAGRRRRNARYQVGRLLHEAGLFERAIKKHEAFVANVGGDRAKWRWFLGWSRYRGRDCGRSRSVFDSLAGHSNTLIGAKAIYWTARCQRMKGHLDDADRRLSKLKRTAPLSYYGLLGYALSGEIPKRQVARQQIPSLGSYGPWAKIVSPTVKRRIKGIQDLIKVGSIGLARQRYDESLRDALERDLGAAAFVEADTNIRQNLEQWGYLWREQSRSDRRIPWRNQFSKLSAAKMTRAYPPAYVYLARAAGRQYGVSEWWLMAHMLQESRYKERARSHARALGLMQILPRTGRRIAERISFPKTFWDDHLFEPGIALAQAAWYLNALRREYDGNVILAMAAYNGGPRRVSEHLSLVGSVPFDMMIEEMGAHETRNYARKVTDHLIRYLDLYASDQARDQSLRELLPPVRLPVPKSEINF